MASPGSPSLRSSLPDGTGLRIGIIAARWHDDIVTRLIEGAQRTLVDCGVREKDIKLTRCEGAYELPVIASAWAHKHSVEAIIAIGVVIRGETPHFEYVAGPVAYGLTNVAIETMVPCILGVLTTENVEQALERSGGTHGNKGSEAAIAAIDTINAIRQLH